MRKLIAAAAVVALFVAACGDAGDESVDSGDSTATTLAVSAEAGATTAPAADTSTTVVDQPIVDQDADAEPTPTTNPGESAAPVEEDVSQPVSHPDPNVAVAMTDLVDRFGVDAVAINVVSVEEVTWSDGSLGCPLPGMRYTQALVNGTRIVLEVGGATYQYHSGPGREPFYCAKPSDPVDGGSGNQ